MLALIIVVIVIVYFVIQSFGNKSSSKYVTSKVTLGSVTKTVSSVGNIVAGQSQIGTFSTSSTSLVTEVDVKPGDTVKTGQILAKIDDSDLQNKLLSANVSLQTAKNNLDSKLIMGGKITTYDIDNLRQSIKIAQSNYDLAKKNLDAATMKAEFNGIVASSNFIVGQPAGTNSLIVYDPQSLYLSVTFNEYDLSLLKKEMAANVTFNSLSGKSYIGKLNDISFNPTITSNVVTYGGKIALLANDGSLKLGFSGTAVIVLESVDDVLTIPTAAIKNTNGQNYVNLLVNGQQQRQDIEIGIIGDTTSEVKSGLSADQTIVVSVNTASTTSNSNSALQLLGGANTGGNFNRNPGTNQTRTGN